MLCLLDTREKRFERAVGSKIINPTRLWCRDRLASVGAVIYVIFIIIIVHN